MDILEEIDKILGERKIVSEYVMGFDEKEQCDWHLLDLCTRGRIMGIEFCRDCTIFLGDWHSHYDPETEWDEFVSTLNGIFDNELCALGSYKGSIEPQNVMGAMLARREDVNEKYVIEEFGAERIVRCCFFDPSLNKEYKV